MAKSVIIIGAGLGGLAAAIRLAHAGFAVTVLEKNPQVGGMVNEYRAGGFRWDHGPPVLTAKSELDALFSDVGQDLAQHLHLQPVDPLTRYYFADGSRFNLARDWAELSREITRLDAADLEGFIRYLAYAAKLHRITSARYNDGVGSRRAIRRSLTSWSFLRSDPLRSMHGGISRHVRSEALRQVLAHFASSAGGSAYAMPAAMNRLAHSALSDGAWYPKNGMYAIAKALERLALDMGVTIHVNCPVKRIAILGGRAIGIVLEADQQQIKADAVISNVDFIATARYLLPEDAVAPGTMRRLKQSRMSTSAFSMMLGVRGSFPELAQPNVFLSGNSKQEAYQFVRRDVAPDDPTINLSISSKLNPLDAPTNQENWLIQVPAPALSEKFDWAAQGAAIRDRVLTILYQRHGIDLRDRIRIEKHLTPADLQRASGAWRGAIYGQLPQGRRPPAAHNIRSRQFKSLYFVGGTTKPGGGARDALISAAAAVQTLRQDVR